MKKSLLFLSTALAVLSCSYEAKAMEDNLLKGIGKFTKEKTFPPGIPSLPNTSFESSIQDIKATLGNKGKDLVQDLSAVNQALGGYDYTSTMDRIKLIWDMVGKTSDTLYNELGLVRFSFLQPPVGTIREDILSLEKRLVPEPSGVIGFDLDKIMVLVTDKPNVPLFTFMEKLDKQLSSNLKIDDSLDLIRNSLSKTSYKPIIDTLITILELIDSGMTLYEGILKVREYFTGDLRKTLMSVAVEVHDRVDSTMPLEDGIRTIKGLITSNISQTLKNDVMNVRNQIDPDKVIEEGLQVVMEHLTAKVNVPLISIVERISAQVNPGANLEQSIQDMGALLTDNKIISLLGTTQVLHDYFTHDQAVPLSNAVVVTQGIISDDKSKPLMNTLGMIQDHVNPNASLEQSIKHIRALTTRTDISLFNAVHVMHQNLDGAASATLEEGIREIRQHLVKTPLEERNILEDLVKTIQPKILPNSEQTGNLEEDISILKGRIISGFDRESLLEATDIIHGLLNEDEDEKAKSFNLEELIIGTPLSSKGCIFDKIYGRSKVHVKEVTSNDFNIKPFLKSQSIDSHLSTFLATFAQDPGGTGVIKIPVGNYQSLAQILEAIQH